MDSPNEKVKFCGLVGCSDQVPALMDVPNLEEESICSFVSFDDTESIASDQDEKCVRVYSSTKLTRKTFLSAARKHVCNSLAEALRVDCRSIRGQKSVQKAKEVIKEEEQVLLDQSPLQEPREKTTKVGRPLIIGHRGAVYMELENTISGFQKAAEIGCDGVELDVFLLKCGTLVVFHGDGDDTNPGWLHTYCGVNASILDYTAEQAREELIFNPNATEFVCPKDKVAKAFIPNLEDVLTALKSTDLMIKIELKGPGTTEPVLEMVERLEMVEQCHFASFNHGRVAKVRELKPEKNADGSYRYKTGCLFTDPPKDFVDIGKKVGASEIHLCYDCCTRERIDAIHAAGMQSMAWFRGPTGMMQDVSTKYRDVMNEGVSMYQTVIQTGVMAMCVNRPDLLVKLVSGKVLQPIIATSSVRVRSEAR